MRNPRVTAVNFEINGVHKGFDFFKAYVNRILDDCASSDIVVFPEYMTLALIDVLNTPVSNWAVAIKEHIYNFECFFNDEAMKRGQVIIAPTMDAWHTPIQNVVYIFRPDGRCDIQHKTKIIHRETKWGCVPGRHNDEWCPRVYDIGYAKFGINLCYEVEFPEIARQLVKEGMEILIVPAATFSEPGFDRVDVCCRARAIENQIFVVHAALQGPKLRGSSGILTPRDVDWSGMTGAEIENLGVTGQLDLDRLQELRLSSSANLYRDFIGE